MDASKRNLSAVKGGAKITKVGHTQSKHFGASPNTPYAMVRGNEDTDLSLK